MTERLNNKAVYRTAPATPGLFITENCWKLLEMARHGWNGWKWLAMARNV